MTFISLLLGVGIAAVTFFNPLVNGVSAWWESLPAQMAGKYDRTSPVTTKCVEDNEEWKTFRPPPGTAFNSATLMRINGSESCKTAWVYVANSLEGTRVDKFIERLDGTWLAGVQGSTPDDVTVDPLVVVDGKETIGNNGKSYTDQVYAPDCVWVSLKLSEITTGKVIWEIPRQEVCRP